MNRDKTLTYCEGTHGSCAAAGEARLVPSSQRAHEGRSPIRRARQAGLAHPLPRPPPTARGLDRALKHHARADRDLRRDRALYRGDYKERLTFVTSSSVATCSTAASSRTTGFRRVPGRKGSTRRNSAFASVSGVAPARSRAGSSIGFTLTVPFFFRLFFRLGLNDLLGNLAHEFLPTIMSPVPPH